MRRETIGIIIAAFIGLILTSTITTIIIKSTQHEDKPHQEDEWQLPEPQLINITVRDVFTTDKLGPRITPAHFGGTWLVAWVHIKNEGYQNYNYSGSPLYLRTNLKEFYPHLEPNLVNQTIPFNQSLPVNSTSEGWLYFQLEQYEMPERLMAIGDIYNGFHGNYTFTTSTFDHRPWKTPIVMSIDDCGRDGPGDERPGSFFMNITVENVQENSTIFEYWHLKLNVTGEGVRDVMSGGTNVETYIHGGEVWRFKLYFDIPKGTSELPETLYDKLNWIFVDVEPELYEDHV